MIAVNVLFNWRLWLLVLIVGVVITLAKPLQGANWADPSLIGGLGHPNYPNSDCGRNWFLMFWTPESGWCTHGGISEKKLDEQLNPDAPWQDVQNQWIDLLNRLAREWGALRGE